MKNTIRIALFLTLIITGISCTSGDNSKNKPFDKSINGIYLMDSASYTSRLGRDIRFYSSENAKYTQHYNTGGDEMLTIISAPNNKFNAIKFRIARLNRKFLMKRNIMQTITKFSTENGICLGMSPMDILKVLGDQYDKETEEDGIIIYRYKKTKIKVEPTENKKKNYYYKSEYHFYRNNLIEFAFGYYYKDITICLN